MSSRNRLLLPLVAVAVLVAVALAVFFWPAPQASRAPEVAQAVPVKPEVAPASQPVAPVKPSGVTEPEPVAARAEVVDPVTGAKGTVVPVGPGDEVPAPEVEGGPEQENDPIEPEKPQTAAWRHSKVVRITEVLGRDVARLEQERAAAQAKGDEAEVKRLDVMIARHQARLGKLKEEAAALAEAARSEPPEP